MYTNSEIYKLLNLLVNLAKKLLLVTDKYPWFPALGVLSHQSKVNEYLYLNKPCLTASGAGEVLEYLFNLFI